MNHLTPAALSRPAIVLLFCSTVILVQARPGLGQTPSAQTAVNNTDLSIASANDATGKTGAVQFEFDRTAWRTVLEWLAEQSDLALHFNELPDGTFTYSDPAMYTPVEAIDRINMFLLPEGFSAVRSANLLSVINLQNPRSLQQLDSMARLVPVGTLDQLGDQDLVKSLFRLNSLESSEVASELRRLKLVVDPVVLEASKQLMVTATAAKLRSVRDVIEAMQAEQDKTKETVKRFALQHVELEEFLEVARPHLGIEEGLAQSEDINISADSSGKNLFVSATASAFEIFENLLEIVDQPNGEIVSAPSVEILRSHRVSAENLQSVYEVLQTVLAQESIRLSMEPATNSIVALADERIHTIITQTIDEMRGLGTEFEIVNLNSLDPYLAITLLDEMFDLSRDDDDEPQEIKLDAEPRTMRLFIRGPKSKVDEIIAVVKKLDTDAEGPNERVIPIYGSQAEGVLQRAKQSWSGDVDIDDRANGNKNRNAIETTISERVVNGVSTSRPALRVDSQKVDVDSLDVTDLRQVLASGNFVSASTEQVGTQDIPDINARVTPRGIVLESQDSAALANFEQHLRSVARLDTSAAVETVVYYLKYSTADDATRLLAELLDGASMAMQSASGASLVNGYVPGDLNSSLFGSYLRSDEDATIVTSGTLTVVADARLNRLICIGTDDDLSLLEQYLELIDKDESLTDIKTRGSAHVIELVNTKASDIADLVRDAYGDRVALSTQQKITARAQEAASKQQRPNERGEQKNNLQTSKNEEPQMSLAVHERSNSIVVTAPDALFQEVEALIAQLDNKSEQQVEVLFYPSVAGVSSLREAITGQRSDSGRSTRGRERGNRD